MTRALLPALFALPSEPTGGSRPAAKDEQRVGQIFIAGNERTRPSAILRELPLFPGQVLDPANLRRAEKNLARTGRFEVDPCRGVRPTVTVLDPDGASAYKDILVTVEERGSPGRAVRYALGFFALHPFHAEEPFDDVRRGLDQLLEP
jgi:hypothetical protein